MEVRLNFFLFFLLAIGFNVYVTTFNGSVSGLSFTEKFRLVFYRTLVAITDANCQRSTRLWCY